MKRLVYFFFFLFYVLSSYCQTIAIESIKEDKDAIFGDVVNDMNGKPCAMVVVDIPEVEGMSFRGNIINDVFYDDGEYYIYVPEGTKHIRFNHEDYFPGNIAFDIPLKGNSLYRVDLRPDNLVVNDGSSWLVLNIKDKESHPIPNCTVLVDEEEYNADENGSLELYLEKGMHDYVVTCNGWTNYNQSVNLGDMPIQCSVAMFKNQDENKILSSDVKRAFSESEAKTLAWYLSDKMTHDLSLTKLQSQDVYEINYDYLRQVQPVGYDSETAYNLRYRNLSLVLDETQWMQYQSTSYFLNPVVAENSTWKLAAFSFYSKDLLYNQMTSSMSHYDGENAASTHYYQARGLGYRDAVSTYVAANPLPNKSVMPFSRLLVKSQSTQSANRQNILSIRQRIDPMRIQQREQQRKITDQRQEAYRHERQVRRQEMGRPFIAGQRNVSGTDQHGGNKRMMDRNGSGMFSRHSNNQSDKRMFDGDSRSYDFSDRPDTRNSTNRRTNTSGHFADNKDRNEFSADNYRQNGNRNRQSNESGFRNDPSGSKQNNNRVGSKEQNSNTRSQNQQNAQNRDNSSRRIFEKNSNSANQRSSHINTGNTRSTGFSHFHR